MFLFRLLLSKDIMTKKSKTSIFDTGSNEREPEVIWGIAYKY